MEKAMNNPLHFHRLSNHLPSVRNIFANFHPCSNFKSLLEYILHFSTLNNLFVDFHHHNTRSSIRRWKWWTVRWRQNYNWAWGWRSSQLEPLKVVIPTCILNILVQFLSWVWKPCTNFYWQLQKLHNHFIYIEFEITCF
jgi:hypothetical protein